MPSSTMSVEHGATTDTSSVHSCVVDIIHSLTDRFIFPKLLLEIFVYLFQFCLLFYLYLFKVETIND